MSAAQVLTRIEGRVGRITLDRPAALHALTTAMCQAMTDCLLAWCEDPTVELVLLDHSGERGFCAGGDIRMLAESGAADGRQAREFFHAEYRLNDLLFRHPKPILTVMDGITMGGGAGLALPSRYRLATERTTFAMPETGIGLFPDVGGGWHLSRMPGHLGLWLALTGARIRAADALLLGVATDYVESARLADLKAAVLAEPGRVEAILTEFEGDAGRPPLAAHQDAIAHLFGAGSMEEIVDGLEAAGDDWTAAQGAILAAKSPQAMKVAFRQLARGARCATFSENMRMEYRIAARVVRTHDFLEGVRAVIVDKDNQPRWDPPTLSQVNDSYLDAIFAPLPSEEEWSPLT